MSEILPKDCFNCKHYKVMEVPTFVPPFEELAMVCVKKQEKILDHKNICEDFDLKFSTSKPIGKVEKIEECDGGVKIYAKLNKIAKDDSEKPRPMFVPPQIMWDIAEVREYGNAKYHDPDNWKTVEVERYFNALIRHTLLFMADPRGKDEESGIEHYKHMACNLAFICDMLAKEKDVFSSVNSELLEAQSKLNEELIANGYKNYTECENCRIDLGDDDDESNE